nr:hypothetical protein CFP56_55122 [Quercus suber]
MVVSPKTLLESEMVACLIDKETRSWDIDKVKGVFLPHEADAILVSQRRAEKVKEYLESVKDFAELVSPQSLFLDFLGPKPSTKVQKNLELKLAKAQEKKAKGGTVSGLLSKKKAGDVSKKDPVVTPPPTHSPAKRPASPTSTLEMIASSREKIRKKKKVGGKSFLPTFWDDANAMALKAYEALFVDDLSPLMAKSSSEALGESLFVSGKLLDLEKKVAMSEPFVKFLSAENERLKNKVAILTTKAENDKKHVATLEKSLQVEKDFKDFDELCKYYVEGFDLLVKWMAKHYPSLDLFGLAMDDVEKELMSDRPSKAIAENVMEEAIDVARVMEEAVITTLADPVPEEQ